MRSVEVTLKKIDIYLNLTLMLIIALLFHSYKEHRYAVPPCVLHHN